MAGPDLAQDRDHRQAPQLRGGLQPVEPVEEREPVLADGARVGLALGRRPRQATVLDPPGVALVPGARGGGTQPVRGDGRDLVQRRPQRLAQKLEAVERADRGQHVGGVGPLPPARLEQAAGLARLQQLVQEALLGAALEQARAELAQDRVVEAGIVELEAQEVLPVDARPRRLRGLPVGQVLPELQQGDQR